jgi:hypothetical protein
MRVCIGAWCFNDAYGEFTRLGKECKNLAYEIEDFSSSTSPTIRRDESDV